MSRSLRQGGFSLMELVIAMAIMSILVAIAIPSYQSYVRKANRAVAKSLISEIQSRQESFFADRKHYAANLVTLAYPSNVIFVAADGEPQSATFPQAVYSLTLQDLSPSTNPVRYSISATPLNAQETDSCGVLSMRHTGRKTAAGGATCWRS